MPDLTGAILLFELTSTIIPVVKAYWQMKCVNFISS